MANSRFLFTVVSATLFAAGCATSTSASSNSASRYVITDAELVNAREE